MCGFRSLQAKLPLTAGSKDVEQLLRDIQGPDDQEIVGITEQLVSEQPLMESVPEAGMNGTPSTRRTIATSESPEQVSKPFQLGEKSVSAGQVLTREISWFS